MIDGDKWFAFFSHSGSEIFNIIDGTGVYPRKVITDQQPGSAEIDSRLKDLPIEIVYVRPKTQADTYDRVLNVCDDCVVTLHGWMNIVPASVCEEYFMLNLHPGLITDYPELKGKDPQLRVDLDKHERIGLVIHEVEAGIDEGPIVYVSSTPNNFNSIDEVTKQLRTMAVEAWLKFLNSLTD